jgi:hypothetical protein
VAGLVVMIGRSIAASEANRGVHASLLGLLTLTAAYLLFNYPAWDPVVASILWMSAALPSALLPPRPACRRQLLRSAATVFILLATGCAILAWPAIE